MSMKKWTESSKGSVEYFMDHTPSDGGATMHMGVDKKTGELYINGKKVLTEQRLTLSWWVNAAIILGALSTFVLAFMEGYKIYNQIP